ncbi:hypothetical protein ACFE04_019576 [Oxalis oulophora]
MGSQSLNLSTSMSPLACSLLTCSITGLLRPTFGLDEPPSRRFCVPRSAPSVRRLAIRYHPLTGSQVAQDDPGLHFILWGSLCDLPAWLSVHPPSPWLVESPSGDLENPLVQKDELCPRCHSVWTLPRLSCVASRRTLKPFFSRPLRQAFLFKLFEPLALSPKGIKLLLAALFDFYLLLFDLGLGPASYSTISGLYSSLSGYSFQAHSLDLQPLLRYKRSAPKQGMVGASNLNLLGVGAEKSSLYSCSSRSKKSESGLSLLVFDPCKPSSDRSERAPQRASSQSSRLAPGSPSSLSVMFNSPAFLNKTFLGGLYKAFPCLGECYHL